MENKYIDAYRRLEISLPSDEEISKIAEEFCCSEDIVQDELTERGERRPGIHPLERNTAERCEVFL